MDLIVFQQVYLRHLKKLSKPPSNIINLNTVSASLPFLPQGQLSVPHFEKGGSEKNECLGGLKIVPATDMCLRGLTMFLAKKDLVK